jgi:hypothetical protein
MADIGGAEHCALPDIKETRNWPIATAHPFLSTVRSHPQCDKCRKIKISGELKRIPEPHGEVKMTLIAAICNEARAAPRLQRGPCCRNGVVHSCICIKECKKKKKKQENSKAESNTEPRPL